MKNSEQLIEFWEEIKTAIVSGIRWEGLDEVVDSFRDMMADGFQPNHLILHPRDFANLLEHPGFMWRISENQQQPIGSFLGINIHSDLNLPEDTAFLIGGDRNGNMETIRNIGKSIPREDMEKWIIKNSEKLKLI